MNVYQIFADDALSFDFVTISELSEQDSRILLKECVGRGGYVLQERLLLPKPLAAEAQRFSVFDLEPEKCNAPLILLSDAGLPPQYSAFLVRPHDSRVKVNKRADSIKVESDGLNLFFSAPLSSREDRTTSSFTKAFDELSRALRGQAMIEANIARTWLYLDDILSDYGLLNEAREAFFAKWHHPEEHMIPASTGIEGHARAGEPLILQACAFFGERLSIRQQASPLQDEATRYGKLFSRCVVVELPRHRLVYISGTASIDRTGASVHQGDFDRQMVFTLDVLLAILRETGGDFSHVGQAAVYLKRGKDLEKSRKILNEAMFPTQRALFHLDTPVCRDDLLCEIELTAAIPNR